MVTRKEIKMFRLVIRGYLRNVWFHIFSVLLITLMMVSSVILFSTLDKQTRVYRMLKPYMGQKGFVLPVVLDEMLDDIQGCEKVFILKYIPMKNMVLNIYQPRVEKYLKPTLSEGEWVDEAGKKREMLCAVISKNEAGIKTGDYLTVEVSDQDGKKIEKQIYICGVISEGQKVQIHDMVHMNQDTILNDFFTTYRYDQAGKMMLITNEKETEKLGKNILRYNGWGILKFDEDLTEEEFEENQKKLQNIQNEKIINHNIGDPTFNLGFISKRTKKEARSLYATYFPLIGVCFMLVCLAVIGINAVKTSMNIKYYAKMFLCGMNLHHARCFIFFEMLISCTVSYGLCFVMVSILKRYPLFGRFYAEMNPTQNITIVMMCAALTLISVVMSDRILKENPLAAILRSD